MDDGINWNKGDASTVPAQVGFNFGGAVPNTLTLPGSRMENITEIDTVTNLFNSTGGQFVFRIDDIIFLDNCTSMYVYTYTVCSYVLKHAHAPQHAHAHTHTHTHTPRMRKQGLLAHKIRLLFMQLTDLL